MKKKSRFKKKASLRGRTGIEKTLIPTDIESKEESEEPEIEEKVEAVKTVASKSPLANIDILIGFGLVGVTFGFLIGYGNLNLVSGILHALAGLFIGIGLGYVPYCSQK